MDREDGGSEIREKLWKDTRSFMRVRHRRLIAALEGVLEAAEVENEGTEVSSLAAMLYEIVEAIKLSRLYEKIPVHKEYETTAYVNSSGVRLHQTRSIEADPSPPPIPNFLSIRYAELLLQTTKPTIALYITKCTIYREARAIHK